MENKKTIFGKYFLIIFFALVAYFFILLPSGFANYLAWGGTNGDESSFVYNIRVSSIVILVAPVGFIAYFWFLVMPILSVSSMIIYRFTKTKEMIIFSAILMAIALSCLVLLLMNFMSDGNFWIMQLGIL